MGRRKKYGFSFSWKRASGLSGMKGKISRKTGIPLTRSGRQKKIGRIATGGCCVVLVGTGIGIAVIAGLASVVRGEETASTTPSVSAFVDLPLAAQKAIEARAAECVMIGKDLWSIRVKQIGEELEAKKAAAEQVAPYKDPGAPRYVRLRDGYQAKTIEEAQSVTATANALKAQVRQVAWENIYINIAKDGEPETIAIMERPPSRILDTASLRLRDEKGPYWAEFPVVETEGRQFLYANRRRHGRVFKWSPPEPKQATTDDVYNLVAQGPVAFPNLRPEQKMKGGPVTWVDRPERLAMAKTGLSKTAAAGRMAADGTPFPDASDQRTIEGDIPLVGRTLGALPEECGAKLFSARKTPQPLQSRNINADASSFYYLDLKAGTATVLTLKSGRVNKVVVHHQSLSRNDLDAMISQFKGVREGHVGSRSSFEVGGVRYTMTFQQDIPHGAEKGRVSFEVGIHEASLYCFEHPDLPEPVKKAVADGALAKGMPLELATLVMGMSPTGTSKDESGSSVIWEFKRGVGLANGPITWTVVRRVTARIERGAIVSFNDTD